MRKSQEEGFSDGDGCHSGETAVHLPSSRCVSCWLKITYKMASSNKWPTCLFVCNVSIGSHVKKNSCLFKELSLDIVCSKDLQNDLWIHDFVIRVVEQWLEQVIAQWVHQEGLIQRPIAP